MLSSGEQHWFIRKVICWRAAASVAWSVLLLPVSTALFVLLSRLSLFHPAQWISDSMSFLCGSYVIFSLVLLCLVVLVISFFNLEYYTVVPSIPCTKIALIGKVLHPQQFIHSLVHCMMGMLVTWCAAVMIGGRYQFLAIPCVAEDHVPGSRQMCLNEFHLFFLLAGAFMGCSYSLFGVVRNMNYVSFQTIQQYKYLRFKGTLPLLIKHSTVQSLYTVRNFCIAYFFLGYIPRAWICATMNLHKDSTLHSLDTIAGLLDFSLIYHLWISGTFLLVTWYITWLLFRIYITEVFCFPVQSSFAEDGNHFLPRVLSCKTPLILKFLALQDLALLSQHSPSRRMEVFSLSQPGGHPHNWIAISGECLSLLIDLTQKLVAYHEAVASNGRMKPHSVGSGKGSSSSENSGTSIAEEPAVWQVQTPRAGGVLKTPGSVFVRSSVAGLRSPLTAPFTPELGSPFGSPAIRRLAGAVDPSSPWYGSVQSPHVMRRGPKLWSSSAGSPPNGSLPGTPSPGPSPPPAERKPSFFSLWLQNRQEQVKNFLARRVPIMYLFHKLPEASSQALFADSQSHIWALEGLSHLVAASYTEDRFGVVQTAFPSILSTMLTLQEAVDKHFKLPHASSKPVRSSGSLEDSTYKTLRFALRASLKTAIYRITTTFGEHLHAVQMTTEHRKRLQQFMEYKE
ncbi:NDC1 protein, partial [Amia calva]|nr:NDC1 protein [Amia calva]